MVYIYAAANKSPLMIADTCNPFRMILSIIRLVNEMLLQPDFIEGEEYILNDCDVLRHL